MSKTKNRCHGKLFFFFFFGRVSFFISFPVLSDDRDFTTILFHLVLFRAALVQLAKSINVPMPTP